MRVLGIGLLIIASIYPTLILADVLGPGCHAASDAEKKAMVDRGLPSSFQVCPADQKILGIGRDFETWYTQLKNTSLCSKNPQSLTFRTRNTGAQVCGPTASRWNAIGCHPNNRTAIFPTVSHGFAAHIELLRRYCAERGRCTIGTVIQQWAEGAAGSTQSPYAQFVSRYSGMPSNQVFDPNDFDLMARIAMSMSCYEAGGLPFSMDDLKKGLIMASGGARVPIPGNVGQLLQESLAGGYTRNPSYSPNDYPGSWSYPQSSLTSSGYVAPKPPTTVQPLLNVNATSQTAATTTATQTASSSSGQGNGYAANIVVQPSQVPRGGAVRVSWSSVGMRSDSCAVYLGGAYRWAGVEGTKSVSILADTKIGTYVFNLKCTSQSGVAISQETKLEVR